MRVYRNKNTPAHAANPYLHIHDWYELYCFLSGDADYRIEGNIYPLETGDLLLIRRSESHCLHLRSNAEYRRIVVHFSREDLLGSDEELAHIRKLLDGQPSGINSRFPGALRRNPHWLSLLNRIHSSTQWARQLYLTTLLHEIATRHVHMRQTATAPRRGGIADVVAYINEDPLRPLTLEQLSHTFFISRSQLNRSFKKATGRTVWDYVLEKRLLLAKDLLRNGHSPTTVGIHCGFGSYSSFFRAYKRRCGISPKEERPQG